MRCHIWSLNGRAGNLVLVATGAAAAEEPKEIEEDLDDLI